MSKERILVVDDEEDNLELGADDYITKSSIPRIMIARVRTVLRRKTSKTQDEKATVHIKKAMSKHPDKIGYVINLLLISRHLERLADHTTNIAEEVIYLIEGEIVRHAAYNRE